MVGFLGTFVIIDKIADHHIGGLPFFQGRKVLLQVEARGLVSDPIEITLRGYELTLRKTEAQFVTMEIK